MRNFVCPACGDGDQVLPMIEARRRRERSCTKCGAALEIEIPALQFYLYNIFLGVFASALVPIGGLLLIVRMWPVLCLLIVALLVFMIGGSMLLNNVANVRRRGEDNWRKTAPGRWYPD